MSISNRGIEFLIYATLGIVPEEIYKAKESEYKDKYGVESYDHYRILKCAQRAYLDLNRTLNRRDNNQANTVFSDAISGEIAKIINGEYEKSLNVCKSKVFDLYEKPDNELWVKVKECLAETPRKSESGEDEVQRCFHYGQFQKWVNMTFKYMNVIGLIKEKDEELLDIPLDSYIMKAMSQNEKIEFPKYTGGKGKYSDEKSVKWSRLTKDEYKDIVDAYKKRGLSIDWEHREWIIMAEKEKKVIK